MSLSGSIRLYSNLLAFRLKSHGPRDYPGQWESYWRTIHTTGEGGEVLWDAAPERASEEDLRRFQPFMDKSLPLLDLGCGNGRQARFLARTFDRVIGVDVSASAVALARNETPAESNITYRVLNAIHPEEATALHAEMGDLNIYMRTVLHVIQDADRPSFAESLAILLGERGTLYQIELSLGALDYFRTLPGDSPSGLPHLVHIVVRHGVKPIGFSPRDRRRFFPDDRWEVLAEGEGVVINTQRISGQEGHVPAYYVVSRKRHGQQEAQPRRMSV